MCYRYMPHLSMNWTDVIMSARGIVGSVYYSPKRKYLIALNFVALKKSFRLVYFVESGFLVCRGVSSD